MIEHGRRVVAVEVKAAERLDADDLSSLRDFLKRTPSCVAGILAYSGEEARTVGDRLWAVPLNLLLS